MKVFQIFNETRITYGGEPTMVSTTMRVLAANGHNPILVKRSSNELTRSFIKRAVAFWSGIYNPAAYLEMRARIRRERPDVIHVHSVYPMFSPSVLVAATYERIPTVMTVHNFSLTCPTSFHTRRRGPCNECLGGREHRCVVNNCRGNLPESIAYSLRCAVARRYRLFHNNVSLFLALTPFAANRLIDAGISPEQIRVIPNPGPSLPDEVLLPDGSYVGFAGRLSSEKGVEIFLEAAEKLPHVDFKLAGDGPLLHRLRAQATTNVEFVGRLDHSSLRDFYHKCRMIVIPSVCYEQFSLTAVEAMAAGRPVIASRIGGLPYVVDEGVTGQLFGAGNPDDLAAQILHLWNHPDLCKSMGKAGKQKVRDVYSMDQYYANLMDAYRDAISRVRSTSITIRGCY